MAKTRRINSRINRNISKSKSKSKFKIHPFIYDASKINPASIILSKKFFQKKSPIHGVGIFAKETLHKNDIIDCAIIIHDGGFYITADFGMLINHSSLKGNTDLVKLHDGNYYLRATKRISKNRELLSDYDGKTIPSFIEGSKPNYKP
jgi:hypothetical protein